MLEELTIKEAKELVALFGGNARCSIEPWKIGGKYLIRTVTFYYTGRVVSVSTQEIELEDAAAIYDTGRHADAIKSGELSEVEPIGTAIVGRGAIVSAEPWEHQLPKEQK